MPLSEAPRLRESVVAHFDHIQNDWCAGVRNRDVSPDHDAHIAIR